MKTFGIIFTIILILFIFEGIRENYQLTVSHHTRNEQLKQPIKIAQLSDLQYPRLRLSSKKILNALTDYQPDVILLTGDTIDRTEDVATSQLPTLLASLAKIAPTYVVSGNHETSSGQYQEWQTLIDKSPASLLKNEVKTLNINGQALMIAGLNDQTQTFSKNAFHTLQQNLPRIILAHRPELFESISTNLPITAAPTFVFSGHAHGGQIRLPFIGGLYSPNQGLFPKLTQGQHQHPITKHQLFISRGLSNSTFPLRINNYPEIIFVTLT